MAGIAQRDGLAAVGTAVQTMTKKRIFMVEFLEVLSRLRLLIAPCCRRRTRFTMAIETIQHRHQIARQEQCRHHAADDDDGQWPLRLGADARREAAGSRPKMAVNAVIITGRTRFSAPCMMASRSGNPCAQVIEIRHQQQTIHDRHAEDRDEADRRRDAEVRARQQQRQRRPATAPPRSRTPRGIDQMWKAR